MMSVPTPENWWQLGAHPKSAAETLTFYSAHNQVKKFKHICGSDQLTHTLTRDQENTGSDWLGKMTSLFIQSESKVGKPKLQQTQ